MLFPSLIRNFWSALIVWNINVHLKHVPTLSIKVTLIPATWKSMFITLADSMGNTKVRFKNYSQNFVLEIFWNNLWNLQKSSSGYGIFWKMTSPKLNEALFWNLWRHARAHPCLGSHIYNPLFLSDVSKLGMMKIEVSPDPLYFILRHLSVGSVNSWMNNSNIFIVLNVVKCKLTYD